MKDKFVIVSPRQKKGGPIALHALFYYLDAMGYDAKIFYTEVYKIGDVFFFSRANYILNWVVYSIKDFIKERIEHYHRPIKKVRRKYFPFVGKNTIVVYPEIVYGNPLKAKKVVRWLMYNKRYDDYEMKCGSEDLFFCYRKQFNDIKLNPKENTLRVAYFDLDFYKRTNFGERAGKCYILRKGADRKDLPESFDGIVIDDLSEEEKVRAFNRCETCISYDTQTAYAGIAAMCGCLSVVIPEEGKKRGDYLSSGDTAYGVAYGFSKEELEYARKTSDLVRERYIQLNNEAELQTKKFIEICRLYFCQ